MKLSDYINAFHGGNKSEFARLMGVRRDVPQRWIDEGWIVIDGKLYSPRRELPETQRNLKMSNFTIEQFVEHANQYEAMPEGEFDTEQAALSAMQELSTVCGFTDMRVVNSDGDVVAESE